MSNPDSKNIKTVVLSDDSEVDLTGITLVSQVQQGRNGMGASYGVSFCEVGKLECPMGRIGWEFTDFTEHQEKTKAIISILVDGMETPVLSASVRPNDTWKQSLQISVGTELHTYISFESEQNLPRHVMAVAGGDGSFHFANQKGHLLALSEQTALFSDLLLLGKGIRDENQYAIVRGHERSIAIQPGLRPDLALKGELPSVVISVPDQNSTSDHVQYHTIAEFTQYQTMLGVPGVAAFRIDDTGACHISRALALYGSLHVSYEDLRPHQENPETLLHCNAMTGRAKLLAGQKEVRLLNTSVFTHSIVQITLITHNDPNVTNLFVETGDKCMTVRCHSAVVPEKDIEFCWSVTNRLI